MVYTVVGPIIKTDTAAIATALDTTGASADAIIVWASGENIFFAHE